MKLKVTWLFVACFCAFLAVALSRLPLRADEPASVSSTTEPYHEFTLYGTRKITTERFKDYKILDEKISAKDPDAPTAAWRSEHHVFYEKFDGELLKSAFTVENADASHFVLRQSQGDLYWQDLNGDRTTVLCNELTHRGGLHYIDNTLVREDHEGEAVFGTGFRTSRNPDKGTFYQELSVVAHKLTWTDVKAEPKDETGCKDPKFPFQMLREKPL